MRTGITLSLLFFQAAGVVSESSLQFGLSESGSQQSLLFTLRRAGPGESDQFQRLPEVMLSCLPPA